LKVETLNNQAELSLAAKNGPEAIVRPLLEKGTRVESVSTLEEEKKEDKPDLKKEKAQPASTPGSGHKSTSTIKEAKSTSISKAGPEFPSAAKEGKARSASEAVHKSTATSISVLKSVSTLERDRLRCK
jgi:hypothetical protein